MQPRSGRTGSSIRPFWSKERSFPAWVIASATEGPPGESATAIVTVPLMKAVKPSATGRPTAFEIAGSTSQALMT